MSKLVRHLAPVLSFGGTPVVPISALAHGNAHHELSEGQLLSHVGDVAGENSVLSQLFFAGLGITVISPFASITANLI